MKMNTQAIQQVSTPIRATLSPSTDILKDRREKYSADNALEQKTTQDTRAIQPEELLNNIKALTEDGLYSVRFEMRKDSGDLIINLVDAKTGEVLRQIPPEEIVDLHKYMDDLRGNIVSIES
jgi:flagellar protein FlaG